MDRVEREIHLYIRIYTIKYTHNPDSKPIGRTRLKIVDTNLYSMERSRCSYCPFFVSRRAYHRCLSPDKARIVAGVPVPSVRGRNITDIAVERGPKPQRFPRLRTEIRVSCEVVTRNTRQGIGKASRILPIPSFPSRRRPTMATASVRFFPTGSKHNTKHISWR